MISVGSKIPWRLKMVEHFRTLSINPYLLLGKIMSLAFFSIMRMIEDVTNRQIIEISSEFLLESLGKCQNFHSNI